MPCSLLLAAVLAAAAVSPATAPLFMTDGPPAEWTVRNWMDVAQDPAPGARWIVRDDTLLGSVPRGTWLMSDREFGDFVLEFDFRLGERGRGGVGFRFPTTGDPAVEGLELQLVDPRFYGTNYQAQSVDLTGAISKALPPSEQVYRPLEWNTCSITCAGPQLTVVINGRKVIDVNLDQQTAALGRGKPLAERPRRGRIGFLELSRGIGQVLFRHPRIKVNG